MIEGPLSDIAKDRDLGVIDDILSGRVPFDIPPNIRKGATVGSRFPERRDVETYWRWLLSIPRKSNPYYDISGRNCTDQQQYTIIFDTFLAHSPHASTVRLCSVLTNRPIVIPIITFIRLANQTSFSESESQWIDDNIRDIQIKLNGDELPSSMIRKVTVDFEAPFLEDNLHFIQKRDRKLEAGRYSVVSEGNWMKLGALPSGWHLVYLKIRSVHNSISEMTYVLNSTDSIPEFRETVAVSDGGYTMLMDDKRLSRLQLLINFFNYPVQNPNQEGAAYTIPDAVSNLITQLRNQGIDVFLRDNLEESPYTYDEIRGHYHYILKAIEEHLDEIVIKDKDKFNLFDDNSQYVDLSLFKRVLNSNIPSLPNLRVIDLDEIPGSINGSMENIENSSLKALAFQIISLTSNTQAIRNNKEFRADMILPSAQVNKLIEELKVINLKSVAGAIDRAGASSPKSVRQIGVMTIRFFSLEISDLVEYLSKIYSRQTMIKEGLDEVAKLIRNRSCIPEDNKFEEEFMKSKDQLKATSHTQSDYVRIARQLGIHQDYIEKLRGY